MSNRAAAAWLVLALLVGGLVAAFMPTGANGVPCGAAFSAGTDDARQAQITADFGNAIGNRPDTTDYQADCAGRRSTQRAYTIPLLIVGVLGGGFLLLTARRESDDQDSRAV